MDLRIDVYTSSFEYLGIISDFLSLDCRLKMNDVGTLEFSVLETQNFASLIAAGWKIEVWRRDADLNLDWRREGIFVVQGWKQNMGKLGARLVTFFCVAPEWYLSRRVVAYASGLPDLTVFTTARSEDIAKILVDYNVGPNATVPNGRKLTGINYEFTTEASTHDGLVTAWECMGDNLLSTLQKLAAVAGDGFAVEQNGAGWIFRYHVGGMGTDRSSTVHFKHEAGNMGLAEYLDDQRKERVTALVGGRGTGLSRVFWVISTGQAGAGNDGEIFVPFSGEDTVAQLEAAGLMALQAWARRQALTFEALQAPGCVFGADYFLSDSALASFAGIDQHVRIVGVRITPAGVEVNCSALATVGDSIDDRVGVIEKIELE